MGEEQLDAPDGPIVAVGPHAADPHYEPTDDTAAPVQHGDWLLIDIWARRRSEDAVFADITWTASVGSEPHGRARSVFETVLRARDATVTALVEAHQDGRTMLGHEADSVARSIIVDAGFGEAFTHRLGHSIGREVHGNGANLDGFETHDVRRLIRGTGFGVRSEINVYLGPDGPEITTPRQTEVVVISI
jgi:Xaa-Pro aminopeptidase